MGSWDDKMSGNGTLYVVGLGPGERRLMTPAALAALARTPVVVGYGKYLDQIDDLLVGKKVIRSGMGAEVERCRRALAAAAAGSDVGVVCSGDPGIFAMAGLLYELRDREAVFAGVEIEVVPGLSAVFAAAAALGSPLTNGCVILSLSDLLTPTAVIVKNLEAAALSELACALYNPAGKKRRELLQQALAIFVRQRGPEVPAALLKNVSRRDEERWLGPLADFPAERVDMNSLIIIGNATSVISRGNLYDRRGYREKYFPEN
ncbi:MAG TPA: precorrin-3B C(17)-methyltransferase [Proteobacteria bacterium]|nr:precorrin-3B C(17)-methyltransferase [Pseudomonadota bacterium]